MRGGAQTSMLPSSRRLGVGRTLAVWLRWETPKSNPVVDMLQGWVSEAARVHADWQTGTYAGAGCG